MEQEIECSIILNCANKILDAFTYKSGYTISTMPLKLNMYNWRIDSLNANIGYVNIQTNACSIEQLQAKLNVFRTSLDVVFQELKDKDQQINEIIEPFLKF